MSIEKPLCGKLLLPVPECENIESEGQFWVLHQYLASSRLLVWLKKAFFTGGSKRSRQHTCKSLNGKQRFSLSSLVSRVKVLGQSRLHPSPTACSHFDPDAYDQWLDPGMRDVAAATELLKPYDSWLMRCFPVSSRINSVANDNKECSRPVELFEVQDRLFSQHHDR